MDQPLADASCIALYFVSKIASEYVKVVLSGEGADELFGGYNIYHEPDDLAGYKKLPLFLRKAFAAIAKALPFRFRGKSFLIRGAQPIEESFIGNCSMFTMEEKRKLLREGMPCTRPQELTRPFYDRVQGKDDVTKMQYLDINVWLVGDILLKADRMSMANSLELRVPFLDKEVFKVASGCRAACASTRKTPSMRCAKRPCAICRPPRPGRRSWASRCPRACGCGSRSITTLSRRHLPARRRSSSSIRMRWSSSWTTISRASATTTARSGRSTCS